MVFKLSIFCNRKNNPEYAQKSEQEKLKGEPAGSYVNLTPVWRKVILELSI